MQNFQARFARAFRQAFALLALSSATVALAACEPTDDTAASAVPVLTPKVIERLDYDPNLFTQGLELDTDGNILVSSGRYGESGMVRMTPAGEVLAAASLPDEYFGEGATRFGDSVWQLTWQEGIAMRRDATSLELLDTANYEGEGWGLCAREDELILSDGTSQLRRMDPATFAQRERFEVTLEGTPVEGLNELECVGDAVYANVFMSTDIVRIDAATGQVTALIDASGLPNNAERDINNVLNGIAHIPDTEEFLVTGKRWPDLYRVTFVR